MKERPEDTIALERRAERVARLRHPNLTRMLPAPGGGGFVPILRKGRPLSELTFERSLRPFELEQVVRILLDVLAGLSALHEVTLDERPTGRVFVHGEVSPRHIYIGEEGVARLVPLLSRHLALEPTPVPNGYGAPELLLREGPDQRADLFSVGVMLWEALSGEPLFPDPTGNAVAKQLEGRSVTAPPTQRHLAWAAPLGVVAGRAISLHPVLRFQTAVEFSNALGVALTAALERRKSQVPIARAEDDEPTAARVPRPRGSGPRSFTPAGVALDVPIEPLVDSTSPIARSRSGRSPWQKVSSRGAFALAGAAAIALLLVTAAQHSGRPHSAPTHPPQSAAHPRAVAAVRTAALPASASAAQPAPASSASVGSAAERATLPRREERPRRPQHPRPRKADVQGRDYGI